ncbi:MAG: hypothetical protein JRI25_26170 [Deltaproteobacteria bacterium]|nr:hypothetical protein [Deltaproteobacteria bacterium]
MDGLLDAPATGLEAQLDLHHEELWKLVFVDPLSARTADLQSADADSLHAWLELRADWVQHGNASACASAKALPRDKKSQQARLWASGVCAEAGHFKSAVILLRDAYQQDYPEPTRISQLAVVEIAGIYYRIERFQTALDFVSRLPDPPPRAWAGSADMLEVRSAIAGSAKTASKLYDRACVAQRSSALGCDIAAVDLERKRRRPRDHVLRRAEASVAAMAPPAEPGRADVDEFVDVWRMTTDASTRAHLWVDHDRLQAALDRTAWNSLSLEGLAALEREAAERTRARLQAARSDLDARLVERWRAWHADLAATIATSE